MRLSVILLLYRSRSFIENCLTKAGGALKLMKVNKRNVELLALTKLHTIFEVFTEEQDAVNSFFPGREVKHFDILKFVSEQQGQEPGSHDGK